MTLSPSEVIGAGHALDQRRGDPHHDAIDGVVPGVVIEPHTPASLAAVLAWASERRLSVLIQGAGTKRAWGRVPQPIDVVLGTRRLNRVLAHRHSDLTVTVEAGATLGDLNARLAAHGQCLPLDPRSADGATIGGLLATNDSGPLRHRFGAPRDLVIGVQLATTDGVLANAGGQVVKNVAGYDLSKLICGSFGTLAAIAAATFKLLPLPAASSTLAVDAGDGPRLAALVAAISGSQLEPVAFEIRVAAGSGAGGVRPTCLIRFASIATAVDAQVDAASRSVAEAGGACRVLSGDEEQDVWRRHAAPASGESDALVRVSWLPADLAAVLTLLEEIAAGADAELIGRAGVGSGSIRIGGDVARQAAAIQRLRQSPVVGHVVVVAGTAALKRQIDVWGPARNEQLLRAIKQSLDPNGILGAGRA